MLVDKVRRTLTCHPTPECPTNEACEISSGPLCTQARRAINLVHDASAFVLAHLARMVGIDASGLPGK